MKMFLLQVIGIIKRKALIKKLAAVYHAECLAYCQELLELQKKWEEVRIMPSYFVCELLVMICSQLDKSAYTTYTYIW